MADIAQLLVQAGEIRDAEVENSNTANRIGVMLIDIISAFKNAITAATSASNGYMTAQQVKDLINIANVLQGVANTVNNKLMPKNNPASTTRDGYMTAQQATQLLDLAGETLITEATTSSFSISLERSIVLETESVDIPVHNGSQRIPALLLPSDYNKIKSNESAIKAQGGVISKISKDVAAALNTNIVFMKMGPRVLGLSTTNGNGPIEGAGIDLPVHGGLDGQTHCDWPALITPEQFNQFELLVSNAPFEFSNIESIPAEAVQDEYAPSDSHYIYNDKTNTFVTASQDEIGRIMYYKFSHKNNVSGYGPVPGRMYVEKYFNRVFVGVNNGLSEIFQTVEIP